MSKFKEYKQLSLSKTHKEVLENWKNNDVFNQSIESRKVNPTFTFNVYSRFSELVYSTNNIHELDCENGWDGKHQISGIDLPLGAYIYQIYYQDFDGWKHQETSVIIIIR